MVLSSTITMGIIAIGGALTIILFYFFYVRNKVLFEIDPNASLLKCWAIFLTYGHHELYYKRMLASDQERMLIEVIPRDIDHFAENEDESKNIKLLETIKLVVPKSRYFNYPKGTESDKRNTGYIIPQNVNDLSEDFRRTPIGQALCNVIQQQNIKDNAIDLMKAQMVEESRTAKELVTDSHIKQINQDLAEGYGNFTKLVGKTKPMEEERR